MEFHEAVRRRAMVRSFARDAVAAGVVEGIVRAALRAPSAGNTGGTAWVVLQGATETGGYWDATTDSAWREASPRWEGLRRAPVILLTYSSAELYVERYAEADKSASGLGTGIGAWPVPYWTGDAAFGVMTVLLAAVDACRGMCVMGNFRGEEALGSALGIPQGWRLFSAVLVGRPDGADHRSSSLDRAVPEAERRVHYGSW